MEDIVKITREELINKLIVDDMDSILNCGNNGREYLYDILLHGHKGYNTWTDVELEDDANGRFSLMKEYKITKKC